MRIVASTLDLQLDNHPWDIKKYQLILNRLLDLKVIEQENVISAGEADELDLMHVHSWDYINRLQEMRLTEEEIRLTELPLSSSLVQMFSRMTEGTIMASSFALEDGISCNLGGGKHHAFPNRGTGFCLFNDLAVAMRTMQAEGKVKEGLIIDLDVHQGDGTAKIFENDDSIFTFSMHQKDIFPYVKQTSNLDINLEKGTADEEYLEKLQKGLKNIISENSNFDLIIYQAGVDPFIDDPLGGLCLSKEGLLERDQMVFDFAREKGIAIASTLGGGYSEEGVDLHSNTVIAGKKSQKK